MLGLPFRKKGPPKNLLVKDGDLTGDEKPKKRERKKKEPPKPWTTKDRIIVAVSLLMTMLLGVYFWYRGQGKLPDIKIPRPSFEEKIILE